MRDKTWEKYKEYLIKEFISGLQHPPFDASIKHFLETGTINGSFYAALSAMLEVLRKDDYVSSEARRIIDEIFDKEK